MTDPTFLDRTALRAVLPTEEPVTVHLYDTLDSTNTEAKRRAAEDDSTPHLYIARTQTGGRGRLGRTFHSPATGLYMTLSLPTKRSLDEAARLTAAAAVAATAAIESLTDKHPRIKWVNDLYLPLPKEQETYGKLAGILTEAVTMQTDSAGPHTRLLVGIGINLTTQDFPDDLRAPAVPLFPPHEAHLATPSFKGKLAGEIVCRLLGLAENVSEHGSHVSSPLPAGESCLDFYRRHLLYVGDRVLCTCGRETFEGIVRGIDEDYSLLVETDQTIVPLSSGEISVRPISS